MNDIFYRNFDMQILRAGEEYLAQTESPDAGNASLNFTLPFSEDGLEALLSKLGPTRRIRRMEKPIEAAKRLGGQLYKAVFSAGLGSALDHSIQTANREKERLRIRLRLTNVPELANLPWEYLYDELNDLFLALSYKTSIVRYLEIPQPVDPLIVKAPLRILVMASSPIGYDELGVDKEWSNLQAALGKMPRGLVEVHRTEKATLMALQQRLNGGNQYHIFHYIGHGGFDPHSGNSFLVMEDDRRQARFVDGSQLGTILHNHPSLRVAILNACEGAVANQNDVFTGVAQNLIRKEVPSVIAMQFEITDSVAIILAKAFYESLARNVPVDTALAEARLAVFAADDRGIEWGTPVLYLRADDGRLFDVRKITPPPPWWVIIIAAIVVMAGGVTVWVFQRHKMVDFPKKEGPNLTPTVSTPVHPFKLGGYKGEPISVVRPLLEKEHLKVNVQIREDVSSLGTILDQQPVEGTMLKAGESVTLTIAVPPPIEFPMPQVANVNTPCQTARNDLEAKGLKVIVIRKLGPYDQVIDQGTAPNTKVKRGDTVLLTCGRIRKDVGGSVNPTPGKPVVK